MIVCVMYFTGWLYIIWTKVEVGCTTAMVVQEQQPMVSECVLWHSVCTQWAVNSHHFPHCCNCWNR